jgi:hypothetical protein
VAGRTPGGSRPAAVRRRRDLAAGGHLDRRRRTVGRRDAQPFRRCAAVLGQGARRRRAAVAAGASQRCAGGGGLREGGPVGDPRQRPGPQLPRPQPQARIDRRTRSLRGAGGFPARGGQRRTHARAGRSGARPLHRSAVGTVRRRRFACVVHHVDHCAATPTRRAGADRPRRCRELHPFRPDDVRGRGQDAAGTRRALSR